MVKARFIVNESGNLVEIFDVPNNINQIGLSVSRFLPKGGVALGTWIPSSFNLEDCVRVYVSVQKRKKMEKAENE